MVQNAQTLKPLLAIDHVPSLWFLDDIAPTGYLLPLLHTAQGAYGG